MTQAIRLLSSPPPAAPAAAAAAAAITYSTTGHDRWPAPSAFAANRLGWVHIFPEGMVHQEEARRLRYFRWGVGRLVLEADPPPDVVPIFIDGNRHRHA